MKVVALTVTYGSRLEFLRELAESLFNSKVFDLVIVDNNSENKPEQLKHIHSGINVHLIANKINKGSAGGFGDGIEFLKSGSLEFEYVILLDDDNILTENAISNLISIAEKSSENAIICNRKDRKELQRALDSGTNVELDANCFCGVSFFRFLDRYRSGPESRIRCSKSNVYTAFAPYGGLFLSKKIINGVEGPRRDYFLYADDHEYTYRISSFNAGILISKESEVVDLETSWNKSESKVIHPFFNCNSPILRVYYSVRNRVHFEANYLRKNILIYYINFMGFVIVGALYTFWRFGPIKAFAHARIVARAIGDGLKGRLGICSGI